MFTLRPTETNSKFIKLFKKRGEEETGLFIFRTIEWGQLYISMYGYSFFFFGGGGLFTMNLSTSPTTFDMYV